MMLSVKLIKSSHLLPTIFLIVGQAGPPNSAGPRSIAVSATMVVTPLGIVMTRRRFIAGVTFKRRKKIINHLFLN